MRKFHKIFLCSILLTNFKVKGGIAESDSLKQANKNPRSAILWSGLATGYVSGMVLLNEAWYKNENQTHFHFHNDLRDWNQMDKAGHFWSAFHLSRFSSKGFSWAGTNNPKAALYGGITGFLLLAPIELLDGYSPTYGASMSDLAANAAGSVFFSAQQILWEDIRIMPKFSYRSTVFPSMRPNTFGKNLPEQMLKDYNGQTYWLSFNISSFIPAIERFPKWLNIAVGYGSSDMMYGNPLENSAAGFTSVRRFYISPDIDLSRIKTKNKILRSTFYLLNALKLPFPAAEFNSRGRFNSHLLMF
jgi:hypothetical protein